MERVRAGCGISQTWDACAVTRAAAPTARHVAEVHGIDVGAAAWHTQHGGRQQPQRAVHGVGRRVGAQRLAQLCGDVHALKQRERERQPPNRGIARTSTNSAPAPHK